MGVSNDLFPKGGILRADGGAAPMVCYMQNPAFAIRSQLKDHPCLVYNTEMKPVFLGFNGHIFYHVDHPTYVFVM